MSDIGELPLLTCCALRVTSDYTMPRVVALLHKILSMPMILTGFDIHSINVYVKAPMTTVITLSCTEQLLKLPMYVVDDFSLNEYIMAVGEEVLTERVADLLIGVIGEEDITDKVYFLMANERVMVCILTEWADLLSRTAARWNEHVLGVTSGGTDGGERGLPAP